MDRWLDKISSFVRPIEIVFFWLFHTISSYMCILITSRFIRAHIWGWVWRAREGRIWDESWCWDAGPMKRVLVGSGGVGWRDDWRSQGNRTNSPAPGLIPIPALSCPSHSAPNPGPYEPRCDQNTHIAALLSTCFAILCKDIITCSISCSLEY